MSKLLIIGASILQLPAIIKAKALGCQVAVADLNPDAVGIQYADKFYNVSTIDIDGILKVVKAYNPDGIMTLATDMPMRAIAVSTTELGLPGINLETAIKATDKGEMIVAFQKYGVAIPWFFVLNNRTEFNLKRSRFKYPCILKPIDSAGSRGVVLVEKPENLVSAYNYCLKHTKLGSVIIEEFLKGDEVSVEVLVVNGQVNILAITDKLTTGPPHFVEMGHSEQSQLSEEQVKKIMELAVHSVKALGIETGPAHVEIMVTNEGPKMIEVGARMGGDYITSHLVPFSTGIDMVKATIELSLGKVPNISQKFIKGSAIKYFHVPCGIISNIEGVDRARKINGVKGIVFNKNIGEEVGIIKNSADRVGYVIGQGKNANEAIKICENAINSIKITVE